MGGLGILVTAFILAFWGGDEIVPPGPHQHQVRLIILAGGLMIGILAGIAETLLDIKQELRNQRTARR